jgi:magnesium transporter
VHRSEIKPEIENLISNRAWADLRHLLSEWPAPEAADLLRALERPDRLVVFRVLPRGLAADVFSYLEREDKENLLRDLKNGETRQLLANLSPDDRTHLLEEMPGQATQRLLNLLDPEDFAEASALLGYPEESVGRIMTPDYVAVRPGWSIGRALTHVRRHGKDSETINRIYVVDGDWRLLDDFELRRLILADPEKTVADLMDHNFVAVSAFDDREEAVRKIQRYDLVALPVLDSGGVLLGIVTVDDLLDVAQAEATEDFHRVGAVEPLKMSYHEATVAELFRRRIGWLAVLVVINLVSSGVIAVFEETLQAVIALAFFIPLLIGSGGNAGAQSATLMVRAIAVGDVLVEQWLRAFLKELGVGATLGLAMGALSGVLGVLRGGLRVGLVVASSMICIVIIANLVGTLLPFALTKLKLDPAVASSPLIATIADACGLVIYFSIATWVLITNG